MSLTFTHAQIGLTKKAEPRRICDVNRDSGTDRANRRWLRRLVRRQWSQSLHLFSNRLVSGRKKSPPIAKLQPIIEHQMPQCADDSEWRAIKPTKASPRPTND